MPEKITYEFSVRVTQKFASDPEHSHMLSVQIEEKRELDLEALSWAIIAELNRQHPSPPSNEERFTLREGD